MQIIDIEPIAATSVCALCAGADPAQVTPLAKLLPPGQSRFIATTLTSVYGLPVLGFEYGINAIGVRRIEHAHWHLLPSQADLNGWLARRLAGQPIGSLTELPAGTDSYIAVRGHDAAVTVYEGDGALEEQERILLRRTVAALDPRVQDAAWDWADQRNVELIRATVADLATREAGDCPHAGQAAAP